ncbi:uncharacterized protein BDW70DRAFT_159737 [Aspergillus foveolatus]|uniref:uncharacterized protein n=1 Tax=Aspergillus foveolatus TaxID=210207 RepID=UPI003CCDF34A
MSSNGQESLQHPDGVDNKLSEENLKRVPDESGRGAERFAELSSEDSPYFARAAMENRSEHLNQLKSQLDATDELLRK